MRFAQTRWPAFARISGNPLEASDRAWDKDAKALKFTGLLDSSID